MVENKSIIKEVQDKVLKKKIDEYSSGVDINFRGYDRNTYNDSIIKKGTDAHINRVLFWLSSKRDDYVRDSFKGGILYDMLGEVTRESNLKEWEYTIKNRFNEEFSGDLDLMLVTVSLDNDNKKIIIDMVVRDTIDNRTFPISTGVEI